MQQDIRQSIIDMFNLGSLEPAKQDELVTQLGELVFESSLARAFSNMEEADQAAIEAKLDENLAPEAFVTLIQEKVPNFQEIVAEELVELKKQAEAATSA